MILNSFLEDHGIELSTDELEHFLSEWGKNCSI